MEAALHLNDGVIQRGLVVHRSEALRVIVAVQYPPRGPVGRLAASSWQRVFNDDSFTKQKRDIPLSKRFKEFIFQKNIFHSGRVFRASMYTSQRVAAVFHMEVASAEKMILTFSPDLVSMSSPCDIITNKEIFFIV
jgi:hypothetical protein